MSQHIPHLRIGCAAGFSGDRTDAAAPVVQALIASGQPAVLIFETLAERTLALAQLARRTQPDAGYEPLLIDLLQPVLADCLAHGVRIVSNFGAANPAGAARRIHQLAAELGLRAPRIAVVQGDDLSGPHHRALLERALGPAMPSEPIVSANAYIGAQAIADALRAGADIVVCGRVADPSLVLGPAMAHYGWAADDWDRLARATMAGHLLECGAQVTGGYFADPGYKDVPGLATLGYPIAEIDPDGHCTITKPAGTGGCINERTVKEQLLYELHDPAAYLTPDVVADITTAQVLPVGPDAVRLEGVRGHPQPPTLKVNVCFESGWFAEGEISYAGPRAEARARLAGQVLRERLARRSAAELAALFEQAGLPFAPIRKPEDLYDDPHLQATGGLADVVLPDGDKAGQSVKTTLLPVALQGARLPVRLDPPRFGAHTQELLEGLGYERTRIDALRARRAVA